VRNLEPDFAAVIVPGLHLAFSDFDYVELSGTTIMGEKADRRVRVCGPGAFVVLKALAFDKRGENKDAYDLYYMIRNYGTGFREVASRFLSLGSDSACDDALQILRRDFLDPDSLGPRRVAAFLRGDADEEVQVEVAGFVQGLLNAIDQSRPET
jgi:hypothetical protein